MLAGRLNEQITIKTPKTVINDYGERVETYEVKYETRAAVQNDSGTRSNENDEIVYSYGKTFNVRRYVPVKETDIIIWQGREYRIITIQDRREWNDKLVTTELINE